MMLHCCYRRIKLCLILLLLATLCGCSAITGHSGSLNEYEQQLFNNNCDFDPIDGQIKSDPLLWTLNGGALARNCQLYDKSIEYFDKAEAIIKAQETALELKSLGQSVNSVLINNNVNDYQSQNHDKIMVNVYKGLNFLSLNDFDNARVEFNRALDRQRRAKEFFADEIDEASQAIKQSEYSGSSDEKAATEAILNNYQGNLTESVIYPVFVNPFATYISAIFFYIDGDYNKSYDLFKQTLRMLPNQPQIKQDIKLAEQPRLRQQHYAWIIYENGQGMIKRAFNYHFPSFIFTDKIVTSSISLPTLYQRNPSYTYLTINGQKTSEITNMDSIIQQEFKKRLPTITTEAVLNMITKSVIQYTLEKELEDYGGKWWGFLYQLATDTADIRQWRALPKSFQTTRIVLNSSPIIIKSPQGETIANIDTLSPEHDAIIYIRSDTVNHNIIHLIQQQ